MERPSDSFDEVDGRVVLLRRVDCETSRVRFPEFEDVKPLFQDG